MSTTLSKLFTFLCLAVLSPSLHAKTRFQLAFTPDIAWAEPRETVSGVALNLWGLNEVRGLNLGFVNGLSGKSRGFSSSLIASYAEDYRGVLWGGFVARSRGQVEGWQHAGLNLSRGSLMGLQSGYVNIGKEVRGVQVGIINYAENLHGIQIGLVNIVKGQTWFRNFPNQAAPVMPGINWSF